MLPISAAVALLGLGSPLAAQVPADAVFSGFQQTGEFLFELAGKDLEHAEIYFSERAVSYLILAPELSSPVLINPRAQSVDSVHLMKVVKRADGSLDVLSDAAFNRLGGFRLDGQSVVFDLKGQPAKLKPKPPLLGFHEPAALKTHKPEYGRLASAYQPSPQHVRTLRAESKEVRVLIYFGTWCPTCSRLVPRVLRLADELKGSKLRFEYYGLPQQMKTDPATQRDNIHGVPTGIVYVGDKEIARLGVNEMNQPEVALSRILNGA